MPALLTGPFPEAVTAMHYAMRNFHQFQQFFQDVMTGMTAIQSASLAMAVTYATTDSNSANSINAVDFAFADGGRPVRGFPAKGVSTLEDQQEARDAAAGRNTLAAAAAQDGSLLAGMTPQSTPEGAVYTFPDGSKLTVSSYSGGPATGRVVTVTDPAHPAVKRTTSTSSVSYAGDQIDTTTDDITSADGTHTTTTVSVTTHQDGSVETTTSTDNGTGKAPTVVHSHSDAPKGTDTSGSLPEGAAKQQQQLGVDNAGTQFGQ
jgi:hypothetical protein